MLHCPACSASIPDRRATCVCGADLLVLQELEALGDAWFNRAIHSLSEGEDGRALEYLAACSIARPADLEILGALAMLWLRLRRPEDARRVLERARAADASAPVIAEVEEALAAYQNASLTQALRPTLNKQVTKKNRISKKRARHRL